MSLTYAKISDEKNDLETDIVTTYYVRPSHSSPSGNFALGRDGNGTTFNRKTYLVDTSVNPPALIWESLFDFDADPEIGNDGMTSYAVDDDGDVWAGTGGSDGKVFKFDKDTELMTHEFTWSQLNDDAPQAHDIVIYRIFTFTMAGGAIKLLILPENVWLNTNPNPWCFLAVKGTPGLTNISAHSSPRAGAWGIFGAFADDNDDIWVYGHPSPRTDELVLWRITDVGGSPYDDYFSVTMPSDGRDPEGYFADGKFVGAWGDSFTSAPAYWYFSVDLASGALQTRDISGAPVFLSTSLVGPTTFEWAAFQNVPPNPDHYFFLASDDTDRTMRELLPDLTDGLEYSLDDWAAGDGTVDNGLATDEVKTRVIAPIYLDGPKAFCSARSFFTDPPPMGDWDNEHSDFFEYYFGGDESPPPTEGEDDTTTIRCWAFSLDDHDFGLFRLGPSETLVVDLKTKQWAEWQSPGRTNFRAHVGCNWVGMTESLTDGGTDVVAGDDLTGVLWRLDPAYGRDDNTDTGSQAFTRKVTGQIPLDGRETLNCGALTLAIALGAPSQAGATITLLTSDNLGQTWINHGAKIVTASDWNAVVEWRAMGTAKAPGRLFSIEDDGATVRIGRADLR